MAAATLLKAPAVSTTSPAPRIQALSLADDSAKVVGRTSALESQTISVGLEPRPIVSQLDTGAPFANVKPIRSTSGSSYWWTGRYSTPASQHGAYQASGGRVFPTHRNSGLSGQVLRAEQEAFATTILTENNPIGVVRGQAREAGLTVFGRNEGISDRGVPRDTAFFGVVWRHAQLRWHAVPLVVHEPASRHSSR